MGDFFCFLVIWRSSFLWARDVSPIRRTGWHDASRKNYRFDSCVFLSFGVLNSYVRSDYSYRSNISVTWSSSNVIPWFKKPEVLRVVVLVSSLSTRTCHQCYLRRYFTSGGTEIWRQPVEFWREKSWKAPVTSEIQWEVERERFGIYTGWWSRGDIQGSTLCMYKPHGMNFVRTSGSNQVQTLRVIGNNIFQNIHNSNNYKEERLKYFATDRS